MTDLKTPDASSAPLVDRAPLAIRPYLRLMRVDRPVGVWLLFIPCVWGTLIARPEATAAASIYGLWALFLLGAFVMRSAGCIYNDIIDRDIDAKVARTANRPLASGQISLRNAWLLLVALCLIGLWVLLQLGTTAIAVGLGALALVAAYPFMKRLTWWPQAWLGLTFNWGVLVGAAAISDALPLSALLYYAAGVSWTLGYDTIYAHQDREEDALVGVKSSARRLGQATRPALIVFYGLTLLFAAAALLIEGAGPWTVLLLPAALHFAWQLKALDIADGGVCLRLFKSNIWAGWLLALPCLAA